MEITAMKKKRGSRVWLWILLLVIVAAAGYYLYARMTEKPKEAPTAQGEPSAPTLPPQKPGESREEKIQAPPEPAPPALTGKEDREKATVSEADCEKMGEDVSDFFRYLDKQVYLQKIHPDLDSQARFQEVLQKLVSRPPVPAGEGIDHRIMIGNLYHLFRTLSRQDIHLIQAVIEHEQDALEANLMVFYQWLTAGDSCLDPEKIRPPFQAAYSYAGFFLNTTGGRAYLYRRPTGLRLLLSYYCLLIVHDADRKGLNTYGIDTASFIRPLRDELIHYPDLQFQRDYVERLSRMEEYYLHKR